MGKSFAEHWVEDAFDFKMDKPALIVVDMLNDFCTEGGVMVLPEGRETIKPQQDLIAAFREKDLPIIFIVDSHRPGKYDAEFDKRDAHCPRGSWGASVIDELKPNPERAKEYVIDKRRYSAFYQTDLDLVLREQGVKTTVVTGVVTNICVRSTCHDAFFRGYHVVVPEDCVRATGPREQESTLWDLTTHFGTVTDSKAILAKLNK